MTIKAPLPENELERIINLSELDLDYSDLKESFKDLTRLATIITGADISLINLIDSVTQWTIASHGIELDRMEREESVCQYTITGADSFEVKSLSNDERFKEKFYVAGDPHLDYYFGIPLKSGNGSNIGALCVMDKAAQAIPEEKVMILEIVADEIVSRLKLLKAIGDQRNIIRENLENKKQLLDRLRSPLSGILSLLDLLTDPENGISPAEVMEYIKLIQISTRSVLGIANEEFSSATKLSDLPLLEVDEFNLITLKKKLFQLYQPQADEKKISLLITTNPDKDVLPFAKNKLISIIGSLLSNALRYTAENGKVEITLDLKIKAHTNELEVKLIHRGAELSKENVELILQGAKVLTEGNGKEIGLGFGLTLAKQLIDSLGGTLDIQSEHQKLIFVINVPQMRKF